MFKIAMGKETKIGTSSEKRDKPYPDLEIGTGAKFRNSPDQIGTYGRHENANIRNTEEAV